MFPRYRRLEVDGGVHLGADSRISDDRTGHGVLLGPSVQDRGVGGAATRRPGQAALLVEPFDGIGQQVEGGQSGGIEGLVLAGVIDHRLQGQELGDPPTGGGNALDALDRPRGAQGDIEPTVGPNVFCGEK